MPERAAGKISLAEIAAAIRDIQYIQHVKYLVWQGEQAGADMRRTRRHLDRPCARWERFQQRWESAPPETRLAIEQALIEAGIWHPPRGRYRVTGRSPTQH